MNYKLSIAILGFSIFTAYHLSAQTSLAEWDFESQTLNTSKGNGTLSAIGSISSSFSAGINNGSSSENGTSSTSSGTYGLQTSSYPSASSNPKTAGISITVSTIGYQNIKLNFDARHTSASANTQTLEYTVNGTDWIIAKNYTATNGAEKWYLRTFDFSSIDSVNNNINFGIRIVSNFDLTDGTKYIATTASTYATNGAIRFDNISIKGDLLLSKIDSPQNKKSFTRNGNILTWNETPNSEIIIFDLSGNIVQRYPACKSITLKLHPGLYIIKTDEQSFKILI